MNIKKHLIRTITLAVLCTVALPVQAFNLSELWNSFKQSPRAQIVAGFSVAAVVASVSYYFYKWKSATPVNHMDTKHTKERLDAELDTLGNIRAEKPKPDSKNDYLYNRTQTNPVAQIGILKYGAYEKSSGEAVIAPKSTPRVVISLPSRGDLINPAIDTKRDNEPPSLVILPIDPLRSLVPQPNVDTKLKVESSSAPTYSQAKASHNATQRRDSIKNLRKPKNDNNKHKEQAAQALEAVAAIEKTQAAMQEETEKIEQTILKTFCEIDKASKIIERNGVTIREVTEQISILKTLQKDLDGICVEGDNVEETFEINFRTSTVAPEKVNLYLQDKGIITAGGITLVKDIKQRIDQAIAIGETKKEKSAHDKQELINLRQIRYVYANDFIAAQFNAYINKKPICMMPRKARFDLQEELTQKLLKAMDKENELNKKIQDSKPTKENNNEFGEFNTVEKGIPTRRNPHPEPSSSLMRHDIGKAPLVINATSVEAPIQQSIAERILLSGVDTASAAWNRLSPTRTSSDAGAQVTPAPHDLMSRAGAAYSAAASAVTTGLNAAGTAAASAVSSAAAILSADTPVAQRPVIIIDRSKENQPEEPKVQIPAAAAVAQEEPATPAVAHDQAFIISPKPAPVINATSITK